MAKVDAEEGEKESNGGAAPEGTAPEGTPDAPATPEATDSENGGAT